MDKPGVDMSQASTTGMTEKQSFASSGPQSMSSGMQMSMQD